MQASLPAAALADSMHELHVCTGTARQSGVGVRLVADGDTVTLTAANAKLTAMRRLPASVAAAGEALVPLELLTHILQSERRPRRDAHGTTITVETMPAADAEGENTAARLRVELDQACTHELYLLDQHQSPQPMQAAELVAVAEGPVLRDAVGQVLAAAAKPSSHARQAAIHLELGWQHATLLATDLHRAARRQLPVRWTGQRASLSPATDGNRVQVHALIPARAMRQVARLLADTPEVAIGVAPQHIIFAAPDRQLTVRLAPAAGFPAWAELEPAPSGGRTATLARAALLAALKRLQAYTDDNTPLTFAFCRDQLVIAGNRPDAGRGKVSVPACYHDTPLITAFNARYLRDGLQALPGDQVIVEVHSGLKPTVLHGVDDSDFCYLLLPVRLPPHTSRRQDGMTAGDVGNRVHAQPGRRLRPTAAW